MSTQGRIWWRNHKTYEAYREKQISKGSPANTQCRINVVTASLQHRDDVGTL